MATYQRIFETVRNAVTTDDTLLDGTTAGATYKNADKPSHAFQLDQDTEYLELIVQGKAANDKTFTLTLFGYAENGPACRMASVAGALGTAVTGNTNEFFADTMTVTDDNLVAVTEKDTADNAVCKLLVPTVGYKYIAVFVTDLGGAAECSEVTVKVRQYGNR